MGQSKSLEIGAHEPDLAHRVMCVCMLSSHIVSYWFLFLLIFPNILL